VTVTKDDLVASLILWVTLVCPFLTGGL
jgi:hypothetical protein